MNGLSSSNHNLWGSIEDREFLVCSSYCQLFEGTLPRSLLITWCDCTEELIVRVHYFTEQFGVAEMLT